MGRTEPSNFERGTTFGAETLMKREAGKYRSGKYTVVRRTDSSSWMIFHDENYLPLYNRGRWFWETKRQALLELAEIKTREWRYEGKEPKQ